MQLRMAAIPKSTLIVIILTIILPMCLSADCTLATRAECGAAGSTCRFFTWFNGTCIAPTNCSMENFTVWSNASFNCVPCENAEQGLCATSCAQWNYYYNTKLSVCTTCAVSYGTQCVACNSSQCITCSPGFVLSSDLQSCFNGQCPISFCQTCADSTRCAACDSTHRLFNNVCVCSLPNCQICSAGTCSSCNTGYQLDSSKTKCNIICIPNCDICADSTTCSQCALGYTYSSSTRQCIINCAVIDPNCNVCTTTTVCSSCITGYTLSLSRTVCSLNCVVQNCITCFPSTNCSQCATGYKLVLNNGTTTYNCSSDICSIFFCMRCAGASSCAQCSELYRLSSDNTSCLPNCTITNCAYCITPTTCQTCIEGFRIRNSTCVPLCSISNCRLCATTSTCLTCADGFIGSANRQTCNFNCGILDCISCNSTRTCAECYTGYHLGSNATRCIADCRDGFYLNSTTGDCIACPALNCIACDEVGKCLNCANLFYLNTTTFTCSPCSSIPNCFRCSSGSGVCITCLTNYYPKDNGCASISQCTVANCIACSSNSTSICSTCDTGYITVNGSCQRLICPSGQQLIDSTCSCGLKLYFFGGQCIPCSDINCLACSKTLCTSCILGYYPDQAACLRCPTNCQECNSNTCITCNNGFIRNDGVCEAPSSQKTSSISRTGDKINCATGCQSCDLDTRQPPNPICRVAASRYVLSGGNIYKCPDNCLTCTQALDSTGNPSACLSCAVGYNFADGFCLNCTDPLALTCNPRNSSFSFTCVPRYTPDNGVCKSCAANCIKCGSQGAGSCDTGGCLPGYFQSRNSFACVQCFNGCLVCSNNPNICTKCSKYLYLSNNICLPCGSNCEECISPTNCTTCEVGYLSINGICRTPNVDNCVRYDATLNCIACDFNFRLSNGSCLLNLSCNATRTCITCSFNFYLSSGQCLSCPSLANCQSCNVLDSTKCISCSNGYYANNRGVCRACPQQGCLTCSSPNYCSAAQDGYYLVVDVRNDFTGGINPCDGLCATCVQSRLNCVTCKEGASMTGSQCISNTRYDIKYTGYVRSLGQNSTVGTDIQQGTAFTVLTGFLTQIGSLFGWDLAEFLKNTLIKGFKKSSLDLTMEMNAGVSSKTPDVLATANFKDVATLALSVVNVNATESSLNLGLVLGVSIPLAILLAAILILVKVKTSKEESDTVFDDATEKQIGQMGYNALQM